MAEPESAQFWDTSALISVLLPEPATKVAQKAMGAGSLYMAWEWIQLEAYSALTRRRAAASEFKSLAEILESFQYLTLDSRDYLEIQALLKKHRLRTADAGHLFCLKKAKKFRPDVRFVCFDGELIRAAEIEKIKVFS